MKAFFDCIVNLFTHVGLLSLGMAVDIGVLLLLVLLPPLRKKYSAKWKCWIWAILAVRLLLPFEFRFQAYPYIDYNPYESLMKMRLSYANSSYELSRPETETEAEPSYTVEPNAALSPALPDGEPGEPFPWKETAAGIWLAGIAGISVFRLTAYLSMRRNIKRWSAPITDEKLLKIYEQAYKGVIPKMGKLPRLYLNPSITSPMTAGIFRPVILLPHGDYPPEAFYHILSHELTHYKRRDVLYKQLFALAQTIHWFNPIVWLLSRTACRDMEIACDNAVIQNWDADKRQEYAQTILSCVREQVNRKELFPSCTTWFSGGAAQLKVRIDCLFDNRQKRQGWVILVLALLIFINGLFVFYSFSPSLETLFLSIPNNQKIWLTYTDDFDHDHKPESFAFVGEDETNTALYFADENGSFLLLPDNVNATDSPVNVISNGENQWVRVESFGGSSTRSYVFFMKNGVPVLDESLNAMLVSAYSFQEETTWFLGWQDDFSQPPEIGGHGFLPYWYFWDEKSEAFREFGAIPITQEQLLQFDGAEEILSRIEQENGRITEILYRANRIMHINYNVVEQDGVESRRTYTLQYDSRSVNIILDWSGTYFNEQLPNGGTYKRASIPEIAVYPERFEVQGRA